MESSEICDCFNCVQKYNLEYNQLKNKIDKPNSDFEPREVSLPLANNADNEAHGFFEDCPPVNQHLNENLHLIWFGVFNELFTHLSHHCNEPWYLSPVMDDNDINRSENNYIRADFRQIAKVRFICEHCAKTWTSMRGVSMFWVTHDSDGYQLRFRLYGQRCSGCNHKDYQSAIWYPEEVIRVLHKVHACCTKVFGLPLDKEIIGQKKGPRVGKPMREHDTTNCQGCQDGICPVARKLQSRHRRVRPTRTRTVTLDSVDPGIITPDEAESITLEEMELNPALLAVKVMSRIHRDSLQTSDYESTTDEIAEMPSPVGRPTSTRHFCPPRLRRGLVPS